MQITLTYFYIFTLVKFTILILTKLQVGKHKKNSFTSQIPGFFSIRKGIEVAIHSLSTFCQRRTGRDLRNFEDEACIAKVSNNSQLSCERRVREEEGTSVSETDKPRS